jgi:hypothetical protein
METFTRGEEGIIGVEYFPSQVNRTREGSETDVEIDLEKKGAL